MYETEIFQRYNMVAIGNIKFIIHQGEKTHGFNSPYYGIQESTHIM